MEMSVDTVADKLNMLCSCILQKLSLQSRYDFRSPFLVPSLEGDFLRFFRANQQRINRRIVQSQSMGGQLYDHVCCVDL